MMNQTRYQMLQASCIAYLEAHLIPMNQDHYRQVVTDIVELLDSEFPNRTGPEFATATKGFLAHWNKTTWPTVGQLIRGLVKHFPDLPKSQQLAGPERTDKSAHQRKMVEWADDLMKTDIGQQAIRMNIASWLWDWAIERRQPIEELPVGLLAQLKSKHDKWYEDISRAAARAAGPLTNGEQPADTAVMWAKAGLENNQRREARYARQFGRSAA